MWPIAPAAPPPPHGRHQDHGVSAGATLPVTALDSRSLVGTFELPTATVTAEQKVRSEHESQRAAGAPVGYLMVVDTRVCTLSDASCNSTLGPRSLSLTIHPACRVAAVPGGTDG